MPSSSFYHSSHWFVTLNLNKETSRWLCDTENGTEETFSANDEVGQTVQSSL